AAPPRPAAPASGGRRSGAGPPWRARSPRCPGSWRPAPGAASAVASVSAASLVAVPPLAPRSGRKHTQQQLVVFLHIHSSGMCIKPAYLERCSAMATPQPLKPIGFYLKSLDAAINEDFARTLSDQGLTRRDWQVLHNL